MELELHEYPKAIALQSEKVNTLEHTVAARRQYVAQLEGNADLSVAIDPDKAGEEGRDRQHACGFRSSFAAMGA